MKKYQKELKELGRAFGINVEFISLPHNVGYFYYAKSLMVLDKNLNRNTTISVFFHELGHAFCYNEKKYEAFHNKDKPEVMSTDCLKKLTRTALKAERYVDKIAAKMLKKYYPNLEYNISYHGIGNEIWLKFHLIEHYEELDRRKK